MRRVLMHYARAGGRRTIHVNGGGSSGRDSGDADACINSGSGRDSGDASVAGACIGGSSGCNGGDATSAGACIDGTGGTASGQQAGTATCGSSTVPEALRHAILEELAAWSRGHNTNNRPSIAASALHMHSIGSAPWPMYALPR